MTCQTNEQALEAAIEKSLTGISSEERQRGLCAEQAGAGFVSGTSADFNSLYALDTRNFWQFLQSTQQDELDKLQRNNPQDWQLKLLERFDRMIKKNGLIHLLKKGLDVDDSHFTLLYPTPLASSGKLIRERFQSNIFSCTRQLHYSRLNTNQSIDMVLFVNGIPLITLELKNAWTGQTARYHGQKQYREDRDETQPLLQFARCLVHMAVDTDEVYMTTRLAGRQSFFLPFNKGYLHGQGNPPSLQGHKSSYLWEDVFRKESLTHIIEHFVRLDSDGKSTLSKRSTLYFPRYHQLDVVRRLVSHASQYGVGQRYLIQHSAGSGKSNSITWAAYQLIETYPAHTEAANGRSLESPLFDSVIVVTDRRLLDKQLKNNIKAFSEVKNILAHADKSSDLKHALEHGKKIIISTIQKFPFIVDGIADLSDKRFAVIIDEAHSSQSGTAHDHMNRSMGRVENLRTDADGLDAQDLILETMKTRKMRGNASYFAFTATPKGTTLEKFGIKQPDGTFHPFHLYSMKQAIEEGFILDVLANYTTYRSYYEIEKSIEANPEFDTSKAQKKLRTYVERSQQTIDIKAEVMLDHFLPHVVHSKKLLAKGKGMVVTQNIETAIRYFKALSKLLHARGNPFKLLIAFSGEKEIDGIKYTESMLNGIPDTETAEHFGTDAYRLLVVANKYLTGFDQPKLCAMYIDKKLAGVQCVQALSRLNRSAPSLGKKTEDLFILDFFNSVEEIQKAFEPFYTATTLSRATDVNVLHELKDELDAVGVYEWSEVEDFITRYFNNEDAQQLSPTIDMATARFDHELGLDREAKVDFKVKAKQYVKIYAQIAAIIPYEMRIWEKLYWFLKFLIPKLKVADPDSDAIDELLESVDLTSYGLQRVKLNHSINLSDEESILDPQNPNPRSAHGFEQEKSPLDIIIETFNERWFQGWTSTPEEQRIKFINIVNRIRNHPDFKDKYEDNPDPYNRHLAFEKILQETMLEDRKTALELYRLYAKDPAFKAAFMESLEKSLLQASTIPL